VTVAEVVAAYLALSPLDRAVAMREMREASREPEHPNGRLPWLEAACAYALQREAATGVPWMSHAACRQSFELVAEGLKAVAQQRGVKLADVVRESCEGFFRDEWAKRNHWPAARWAKDPVRFLATVPRAVDELTVRVRKLEAEQQEAVQRGEWDRKAEIDRDLMALYAVRRQRMEAG
jgi:hypothetical protein